jgi:hypothetical protein
MYDLYPFTGRKIWDRIVPTEFQVPEATDKEFGFQERRRRQAKRIKYACQLRENGSFCEFFNGFRWKDYHKMIDNGVPF